MAGDATITIVLPYPDAGLSPNARIHFRPKSELARSARQEGRIIGLRAGPVAALPTYALRLTFCPPDRRGRDLDNAFASCKPALDGVADALGLNDRQFQPVTLDWGELTTPGQVVVEIDT